MTTPPGFRVPALGSVLLPVDHEAPDETDGSQLQESKIAELASEVDACVESEPEGRDPVWESVLAERGPERVPSARTGVARWV